MSAGTLRLIGASNIFPLLSSACQFFSPRWAIIATIRPSVLSFLRLPFLVTSPRCIFRVTPLRRRYADCVQCLCVCECQWTINRSRSIAFADSGKIEFRAEIRCTKKRIDSKGKPVAPPLVTGCTRSFRVFTRVVNLGTVGKYPTGVYEAWIIQFHPVSLSPFS